MASGDKNAFYIGLDFSTQQIKVNVIDEHLKDVYENAVRFDTDLPQFRTSGGVHMQPDNVTVTAPTILWVQAFDLLLERMRQDGFDFSKVAGISGAGQQHGSVYWTQGAREILKNLNSEQTLGHQLKDQFSIKDSPIWMDSSTTSQCRMLEEKLGGPQAVADLTGSRAYERFTGNQIAKLAAAWPAEYGCTERVALVSSFAASLLLGDYAPIDDADGSGMNLLDIKNRRQWVTQALDACAPNLGEKLGDPVPSGTCLGCVSPYYVERYGFNSNCKVIAFTGDNPSSLAGMRLQKGDVVVSMGTSDTLMLWLDTPKPATMGHVLANPLDTRAYMALLCYKNGSLTREKIRDSAAEGSWEKFQQLLENQPIGNEGCIGMYYDIQEITPHLVGVHRFGPNNKPQSEFRAGTEVRAVVEGQFLAKRLHAEALGYKIGAETRVLATGGASNNQAILQVLCDVFGAGVYVQSVANSASLGGAYRAKQLVEGAGSFSAAVRNAPEVRCVARPDPAAQEIYAPMLERFRKLEQDLLIKQAAA